MERQCSTVLGQHRKRPLGFSRSLIIVCLTVVGSDSCTRTLTTYTVWRKASTNRASDPPLRIRTQCTCSLVSFPEQPVRLVSVASRLRRDKRTSLEHQPRRLCRRLVPLLAKHAEVGRLQRRLRPKFPGHGPRIRYICRTARDVWVVGVRWHSYVFCGCEQRQCHDPGAGSTQGRHRTAGRFAHDGCRQHRSLQLRERWQQHISHPSSATRRPISCLCCIMG